MFEVGDIVRHGYDLTLFGVIVEIGPTMGISKIDMSIKVAWFVKEDHLVSWTYTTLIQKVE
jgi:hypothetical protein